MRQPSPPQRQREDSIWIQTELRLEGRGVVATVRLGRNARRCDMGVKVVDVDLKYTLSL